MEGCGAKGIMKSSRVVVIEHDRNGSAASSTGTCTTRRNQALLLSVQQKPPILQYFLLARTVRNWNVLRVKFKKSANFKDSSFTRVSKEYLVPAHSSSTGTSIHSIVLGVRSYNTLRKQRATYQCRRHAAADDIENEKCDKLERDPLEL